MPFLIESSPSEGPTVRSSRYVRPAGQRARPQDEREVVGLLGREAALDHALLGDAVVDVAARTARGCRG